MKSGVSILFHRDVKVESTPIGNHGFGLFQFLRPFQRLLACYLELDRHVFRGDNDAVHGAWSISPRFVFASRQIVG